MAMVLDVGYQVLLQNGVTSEDDSIYIDVPLTPQTDGAELL